MIFGYSRVSTISQKDNTSLKSQEQALKAQGAEKIFSDIYTGSKIERTGLNQLLSEIRTGDTLVCTKLDRLSRNIIDGLETIQQLNDKGVKVVIGNLGTIDNTATGKLTLSVMLAFGEFERNIIIERLQTGRKMSSIKQGRARIASNRTAYAVELLKSHSYSEVERITGISKSTLQRRKKEIENQQ